MTQHAARLGQNGTADRSISGMAINIGNVGSTYQKVATICEAMRSVSPVSRHSQITARIDTSGSDTMSAPSAGLRFATSETMAMMMPEISALMTR